MMIPGTRLKWGGDKNPQKKKIVPAGQKYYIILLKIIIIVCNYFSSATNSTTPKWLPLTQIITYQAIEAAKSR